MEFVRGDSQSFKFLIKYKDSTPIKTDDIESLFLTCKKNIYSNEIVFQKNIKDVKIDDAGCVHVTFEPKDTETLDYGKYVFDIEITTKAGYRKTKLFEFELLGETTFHGGDLNGN